jgi:hypothetical protein
MRADRRPGNRGRRGFVIGELLIAVLLLAVAVSTLAALMYSVSRRPAATSEETECVGKNATSSPRCIAQAAGGPSRLLRSGCATRMGAAIQTCKDSLVVADSVASTVVLKPRTDSAAMALLEKKQKASQPQAERPDRGFIR